MTVTDQGKDGNFSNVLWSDHIQDQTDRSHSPPDPERPGISMDGPGTDIPHEPHALGSERLDCTVTAPIKENDSTKDAFVSYLITTNV